MYVCTSRDDLYYGKSCGSRIFPKASDKEQDWGKYYQAENLIFMISFDSCSCARD